MRKVKTSQLLETLLASGFFLGLCLVSRKPLLKYSKF
jgi:hypothetical protein